MFERINKSIYIYICRTRASDQSLLSLEVWVHTSAPWNFNPSRHIIRRHPCSFLGQDVRTCGNTSDPVFPSSQHKAQQTPNYAPSSLLFLYSQRKPTRSVGSVSSDHGGFGCGTRTLQASRMMHACFSGASDDRRWVGMMV